jgi:hypothetical protein
MRARHQGVDSRQYVASVFLRITYDIFRTIKVMVTSKLVM